MGYNAAMFSILIGKIDHPAPRLRRSDRLKPSETVKLVNFQGCRRRRRQEKSITAPALQPLPPRCYTKAAMNAPFPAPPRRDDFKARFTSAEFLALVDSGAFADMKLELVRGELERMNTPGTTHGFLQARITLLIGVALIERPEYIVYGEVGIDLGNDTVRGCDAAIATVLPTEGRRLRPDEVLLVVEIADETLSRDLGAKAADYAAAGIPEYWVIDARGNAVTVMTDPRADGYAARHIVRFGEPLAVPGTGATITL
ncbi:hypothetical protein IP88_09470 [alpha proteobacterium AAP81b]|nr:hypothetical protein IP88_09470 [alpha proteobacterium AAP81b]